METRTSYTPLPLTPRDSIKIDEYKAKYPGPFRIEKSGHFRLENHPSNPIPDFQEPNPKECGTCHLAPPRIGFDSQNARTTSTANQPVTNSKTLFYSCSFVFIRGQVRPSAPTPNL